MTAPERERDSSESAYLEGLAEGDRASLLRQLWDQQGGVCYLSGEPIDLEGEADILNIEHIEPLREGGSDDQDNLALVKRIANENRQAGDLRVARILARFDQSRTKSGAARQEPRFESSNVAKDADFQAKADGPLSKAQKAGERSNGAEPEISVSTDAAAATNGADDRKKTDQAQAVSGEDRAAGRSAGNGAGRAPHLNLGAVPGIEPEVGPEGRFAGPGKMPKLRPLIADRRLIADGRPEVERKEKPAITPKPAAKAVLDPVEAPRSVKLPATRRSTNLVTKRRRVGKIDRVFDQLRLRIVASAPQASEREGALVVAFTARTRGEGVSTVAGGLARSFARSGGGDRTLLIDADESDNGLARRMPGKDVTVLDESRDLDPDLPIGRIEAWGLDGIVLPANESGGFTYDTDWDAYVSVLRARYDTIVVDSGSLQNASPYYWAPLVDQIFLVVDAGTTTTFALERLRRELDRSAVNVAGVILNKREFPIPGFLY